MKTSTADRDICRMQGALEAAAQVADQLDLPITMRQLRTLLEAAEPHLAHPTMRREDVPATFAQRLLQSLVAAGWPLTWIAVPAAMRDAVLGEVFTRRFVTRATEQRIARAFAELYGVDPAERGVQQRGISRARNMAFVNGWTVISADEAARIIGDLTAAEQNAA